MLKKSKGSERVKILLVDEFNDLQTQVAEFFIKEMYGDIYDVHSAGPKFDCVNCELVSAMYQIGHDIRMCRSKDFRDKKIPGKLDYIIFLEKETYDRIKTVIPWDAPQILVDFGRKDNFEKATDDVELFECYKEFIERIRTWVDETFDDPEKLKSMVI